MVVIEEQYLANGEIGKKHIQHVKQLKAENSNGERNRYTHIIVLWKVGYLR